MFGSTFIRTSKVSLQEDLGQVSPHHLLHSTTGVRTVHQAGVVLRLAHHHAIWGVADSSPVGSLRTATLGSED